MSSKNEKEKPGDHPKSEFIMKELNRISQKAGPITTIDKSDSAASLARLSIKNKPKYPWYIIFILGNELCERFAFYGMKAVLTLYFLQAFLWSESTSTLVYHVFLVLSYFTPVFGAMLADGYIGKFATIFLLSIVYVGGLVLMTLASIPPIGLHPVAGFISGLLLVAIGTGGIKPCVVTYGGDQFVEGQEGYRQQFFSVFYFCINAGSLVSTFVTPILRSDVACLGQEGCYPAAFGLPAGLLAVAVILFVLGRPFYRNVPPTGNIVGKVISCIWRALANKWKKNKPPGARKNKPHWLDYASDKYDDAFISDVKKVMPVLKMFLPLPIFWTLFDQKGSRWTFQANKMDGRITDSFYWKPDQVQIFNPVLILILVPIFEAAIFPLIERCGIKFRLLARMVTGMLLAGVAFVVAGFLQIELDRTLPNPPPLGHANVHLFNMIPCNYTYDLRPLNNGSSELDVGFHQMEIIKDITVKNNLTEFNLPLRPKFDNCSFVLPNGAPNQISFRLNYSMARSVFISESSNGYSVRLIDESIEKPKKGASFIRFIIPFILKTDSGGGTLTMYNPDATEGKSGWMYNVPLNRADAILGDKSLIVDAAVIVDQGKYELFLSNSSSPSGRTRFGTERLAVPNGGIYTIILQDNATAATPWETHAIVQASSINIFWQLPQYFLITLGEVLFSVSGVAFAYSQAPTSMKAVLQAGWLMTTAFGNVIVIIISGAQLIANQATEFFVFAGLIGAFAILFAVMTKFYKYVDIPAAKNEPKHTDTEMTKEEIEEGTEHQ